MVHFSVAWTSPWPGCDLQPAGACLPSKVQQQRVAFHSCCQEVAQNRNISPDGKCYTEAVVPHFCNGGQHQPEVSP